MLSPILREVKMEKKVLEIQGTTHGSHGGVCAICLNHIALQEPALVRGCEPAYCVTCILQWASYSQKPTCSQCKHPFEFLIMYRSLDGRIHDYMFEESVCLLLRASWFKPSIVEDREENCDEYYVYEDEDEAYLGASSSLRVEDRDENCDEFDEEALEEAYLGASSSLRLGNLRWGVNGYVRAGRQAARLIFRPAIFEIVTASSSGGPQGEGIVAKNKTGRRAKRALKREVADKAAAEKHQERLARFGQE